MYGADRVLRYSMRFIAVVAILVLSSPLGHGHHIRGIPHYSYTENYPHAPVIEEHRITGPFELRFTYFSIPGAKGADLALYIKDRRTKKPYPGRVEIAVYGQDEDPAKAHGAPAYRNKVNIYKVGWVYEVDGTYYVRARFGVGKDVTEEIFQIQVGETRLNHWFLGAVAGGVLLLIVVVGILNRNKSAVPSAEKTDDATR